MAENHNNSENQEDSNQRPEPNTPKSGVEPPRTPRSWATWIMVAILGGVLFVTMFMPDVLGMGKRADTLTQFFESYQEGRVITGNEKMPLVVTASDSTNEGHVTGYRYKKTVKPLSVKEIPFAVSFNTALLNDKLKTRLDNLGAVQQQAPNLEAISFQEGTKFITPAAFDIIANQGRVQKKPTPVIVYGADGAGVLHGVMIERTWPEPAKASKDIEGIDVPFNMNFQKEAVYDALGKVAEFRTETNTWGGILMSVLPILLLVLLFIFFMRMQGRGPRDAMKFGSNRARLTDNSKNKITFKDVAGVSEAKEEVWEIVEFLKDPEKFRKLGAKIPRGILMVGLPGTGKTLLAKAIAGEADASFYTISGSDFVEMFVGVGASRVRDMFEQAKKTVPSLLFIDEVDAVGRHRGYGVGGGNDEREQTLNALLVEMDGFQENQDVIVIAATNRPDVLDPALMRPGRFDRRVEVPMPDVKGREQILAVHANKVVLGPDIDLSRIARGTPGFSGAELANLINEGALIAARKGLEEVTQAELEEARDKVRWGRERKSLAQTDHSKRITAVHEAGHAICLLRTEHSEPLHKVTIIPRGAALGATMWLPAEDKYHVTRSEMLDSLVVAVAGRCAEEIIFGDVTGGASGDISSATSLVRRMVCELGMSEKLGMVKYGEKQGEIYLGRDMNTRSRDFSERTAEVIDDEVRDYMATAYSRAREILLSHRTQLEAITDALMEYETLDGTQIIDILEHGSMQKPPTRDIPPPLPLEPLDDAEANITREVIEDDA